MAGEIGCGCHAVNPNRADTASLPGRSHLSQTSTQGTSMPSVFTPDVMTLIVILLFALAAVAIVAYATMKVRRAALELIQKAVDRGERLEPHVIERLLGPRTSPRKLLFPGIMTVALGIGVAISGVILADSVPAELAKRLGNGAILACLGIGLIVTSRTDRT
jgi:hypothetical protein